MQIRITARQCEITDPVRERAVELMEKVARFDPRISAAELVFEEERHTRRVEAILSRDRVDRIVAKGEASEWMPALNVLVDRLSRRVRRARAQAVEHQATVPAPEPTGD